MATMVGRLLSVALVLVLSLALLVAPAEAQTPQERGIDRVCPVADDQLIEGRVAPFPDAGTTHADAIACAAEYSLIAGFVDGTFRPDEPVTRGQMATFVASWVERATGFALAQPETVVFTDVDESTHFDAIGRVADAGIVSGRSDGTFRPGDPLTRGQFTRAVANAISYADVFRTGGPLPPTDVAVTFDDIDGSTFEDDIRALAGAGIALGRDDGRFHPNEAVTRGQLATFLMRGADYLDRHQRWKPTASTVLLIAELRGIAPAPEEELDDPPEDEAEPDDPPQIGSAPSGSVLVTLTVNAFNGSLGYLVDVSGVPSTIDDDAALEVRLGPPDDVGRVVLTLADGVRLEDGRRGDGFASGSVMESDSAIRLADLTRSVPDVTVELRGDDLGRYRGALERVR